MRMITDLLRILIWGFVSAIMIIMDFVYETTMKVASLDILSLDIVWNAWTILSTFLGIIIIFRVISMVLKYYTDYEGTYNLNIFSTMMRVGTVVLVMAMLPFMAKQASLIGKTLVNNVNMVTGVSVDTVPSTLLISSVHASVYETEDGLKIPKNYNLSDISINDREGDKYIFFDPMSDLVILLIVGGVGMVGFLINALQIAQRLYALAMKILISPLPIASLVDSESDQFSQWVRMCLSDLISNFIQILLLTLILQISASKVIRLQGAWVTIIMVLAGVLTLLTGVPELARLIGGDTSGGSAIQQFASIRQATRGIGSGFNKAARTAGGAIKSTAGAGLTVGAVGAYGVGRSLGGKSMNDLNSNQESTFRGSSETTKNDSFVHTGGSESNVNQNHGGSSNQGFQNHEGSFQNHEGPNSQSSQNQNNSSNRFSQNDGGSMNYDNPGSSTGNHEGEFKGASQDYRQRDTQSLARDNTFASKVSETAYTKHGLTGKGAKVASFGSAHIYAGSINRMQRSAPARLMRGAKNIRLGVPTIKPIPENNRRGDHHDI